MEIPDNNSSFEIEVKDGSVYLKMDLSITETNTTLITTKTLGTTIVSETIFEQNDGTPYMLDTDFLGTKRDPENPKPGPFEKIKEGKGSYLVWDKK
jgi:hypothetical protein